MYIIHCIYTRYIISSLTTLFDFYTNVWCTIFRSNLLTWYSIQKCTYLIYLIPFRSLVGREYDCKNLPDSYTWFTDAWCIYQKKCTYLILDTKNVQTRYISEHRKRWSKRTIYLLDSNRTLDLRKIVYVVSTHRQQFHLFSRSGWVSEKISQKSPSKKKFVCR